MTPNATIISPNASSFELKESNENSDTTIDDVLVIKLKSLLIPNQNILRTKVPVNYK
jgi:hypothetical protein